MCSWFLIAHSALCIKKCSMRVSPRRHVLVEMRQRLGLTQSQMGALIGVSRRTVQSIELGTMPMSERIAYAICEKTGVRPDWLLKNDLKSLARQPDLFKDIHRHYEWAQAGGYKGLYGDTLIPRMVLFRAYIFLRTALSAAQRGGMYKAKMPQKLAQLVSDVLKTLPDKQYRKELYTQAQTQSLDPEAVLNQVIADARELRDELRKRRARGGLKPKQPPAE
jgi:transcriptional regulator with XRE-family HTH domain